MFKTRTLSSLCSFHYDLFIPTHITTIDSTVSVFFSPMQAEYKAVHFKTWISLFFFSFFWMASWAWRIRSQAKDILYHLQKLIRGIFAFPLSITLISTTVTSRAAALILKIKISALKKKKNNQKKNRWDSYLSANYAGTIGECSRCPGVGLSFTPPLTSCLLSRSCNLPAFSRGLNSYWQEWRDWQVKGSFLVRRGPLCLSGPHVFPELTFHIPAWPEQLFFWISSAVKIRQGDFLEPPPHQTFHTLCLKRLPCISGGNKNS